MAQLFASPNKFTETTLHHPGLVWFTKILTDPLHDVKMYHKAPLALMRGELIDPMKHVR